MLNLKHISILISLSFLLQSCITQMHTEDVKKKYQPGYEFADFEEVDTNLIIKKEAKINIIEGVYLGEVKKSRKNYYNLQFDGLLEGKNRILDMYIPTDGNSFPFVYEIEKIKKGKPAFLSMEYFCCFADASTISFDLFYPYARDTE